ncbi:TetR family transcriptional regulator [Bifidobacterium breve]|nr:TetR family transcriptional regulator [Bifidobacterium breve]
MGDASDGGHRHGAGIPGIAEPHQLVHAPHAADPGGVRRHPHGRDVHVHASRLLHDERGRDYSRIVLAGLAAPPAVHGVRGRDHRPHGRPAGLRAAPAAGVAIVRPGIMRLDQRADTGADPARTRGAVQAGGEPWDNASNRTHKNESRHRIMNNEKKTTPRHRPETEERRQSIIEAAADVFGSKGTANGTLQEVADRVGMTRAGVLHYFGSKRGLLEAVLRNRDSSEVAEFDQGHLPRGAQAFRHLVETAELNASRPNVVRTFVTLSAESVTENNPGNTYFHERYDGLRNELKERMQDMADEMGRDLDEEKAEAACASIIAVMDGLQLQWLIDKDHIDMPSTVDFAIKALIAVVFDHRQTEIGHEPQKDERNEQV